MPEERKRPNFRKDGEAIRTSKRWAKYSRDVEGKYCPDCGGSVRLMLDPETALRRHGPSPRYWCYYCLRFVDENRLLDHKQLIERGFY